MKKTSLSLWPCLFMVALIAAYPHSAFGQKNKTKSQANAPAISYEENLYNALQWRTIGPYRGGRSGAVTGVPGKPKGAGPGDRRLCDRLAEGCDRKARPLRILFLDKAGELVVEARNATATVQHVLVAAGPGRVGQRIDVQVQDRAFLLVGRARLIGRTIGHLHGDEVVVGVGVRLHGLRPVSAR